MTQVVGIQFQPVTRIYHFDPAGYTDLLPGEWVIVETVRGRELAQVVLPAAEVTDIPRGELKSVVRRATAAELAQRARWQAQEPEVHAYCQRRANELKLKLKVVRCLYSYNGRRLLIEFVADVRIDFRQLVKDLMQKYTTRIEMRQVGARDQAKVIGGFGKCGRDLCCSSFLRDFHPVSIKMAKNQNLPLNPTDISGSCGRLLCSLAYENDLYTDVRKGLPRLGQVVETPQGAGKVRYLNVLMERVTVDLETGSRVELAAADLNVPGDIQRRYGGFWERE